MRPASADDRQAAVAHQINTLISQGRRIEVQNPLDAVLTRGRLIELRERVTVDQWGNVQVEKLPLDLERLIMLIGALAVVFAFIIYATVTS